MKRTVSLGVIAAILLTSCMSIKPIEEKEPEKTNTLANAINALDSKNFMEYIEYLDTKQTKDAAEKNLIRDLYDKAMIHHFTKNYAESKTMLEKTDFLMKDAVTKSISDKVASSFGDNNQIEYAGHPYEYIYLNIFNALNYYNMGDVEEAGVEIRKLNEKQREFLLKYGDWMLNYDPEKYMSEQQTKSIKKYSMLDVEEIPSYVKKPAAEDIFKDSPTARYLSMLFYLMDHDEENAKLDAYALNQFNQSFDAKSELSIPDDMGSLNVIAFANLIGRRDEKRKQIILEPTLLTTLGLLIPPMDMEFSTVQYPSDGKLETPECKFEFREVERDFNSFSNGALTKQVIGNSDIVGFLNLGYKLNFTKAGTLPSVGPGYVYYPAGYQIVTGDELEQYEIEEGTLKNNFTVKLSNMEPLPVSNNEIASIRIKFDDGKVKQLSLLEDFNKSVQKDVNLTAYSMYKNNRIRATLKYISALTASNVSSVAVNKINELLGSATSELREAYIYGLCTAMEAIDDTEKADIRQVYALPSQVYANGINLKPGKYSFTVEYLSKDNVVVNSEKFENVEVKQGVPTLVESLYYEAQEYNPTYKPIGKDDLIRTDDTFFDLYKITKRYSKQFADPFNWIPAIAMNVGAVLFGENPYHTTLAISKKNLSKKEVLDFINENIDDICFFEQMDLSDNRLFHYFFIFKNRVFKVVKLTENDDSEYRICQEADPFADLKYYDPIDENVVRMEEPEINKRKNNFTEEFYNAVKSKKNIKFLRDPKRDKKTSSVYY